MATKRIAIHAADIVALTGRSESAARRLLRKIRREGGKQERDLITIGEFCRHTRMDEAEVSRAINRV